MTKRPSPTATRKWVDCIMEDENSKSSCTMQIPKLCRQTHGGPIYCQFNVRCPLSEVTETGKRHKVKTAQDSQTMRSGQSHQNIWDKPTTFMSRSARNTQQEQVNNTNKLPQLSQCFSVAAKASSAILPCSGKICGKCCITGHFTRKTTVI